ncbi:group II intron reverse transcriptase/maturase [Archangium sp.]|uniref:group II intron reverse transcriptase/maturase n=1 Tax=Archangium sp. TaxID=1872627 RepID=UPI002D277B74|nr:group II intron reverse transcriptase/maturase [Archangium sp.]HYO57595.1 group II intron reverse transcriptase/maturase [Archangium sp.]
MAFTTLAHHIDLEWLREAYRRTRKDGAVGVDGQTAEQYAQELEGNLQSLLDRAKSGDYRAPPVRRVHIPKGDGKTTRPLGIPTFEDKVLQRAVAMVLEEVYEQDFLDCSYGFRPGRSAHQALQRLWGVLMDWGGGWVLEVDIQKFFDTLDHGQLRQLVQRRVRDGVVLNLIGKWLKAGVLEGGEVTYPDQGTPQGGVISPLLANIYLHEVLDVWWEREVKPRLKGRAELVRYADDFVICLTSQEDARRVMEVLPKRMGKYGLTLHPEKTRLVEFRPPRPGDKGQGPRSFDLLGLTLHWGKSRKGKPVVKRKTAASRLRRGLERVAQWCQLNRHLPVEEQHRTLKQKMLGHYSYYGVTGNWTALSVFAQEVRKTWHKWMARRSQRGMDWESFNQLLRRLPLPGPRIVHSVYRLAANP